MSGAIYDPSVDVIDTFFQVTPLTGSVFQITGSVDALVTGSVTVTNFPAVQVITGSINTVAVQQTSSVTLTTKFTASLIGVLALASNTNRRGASFYKEGAGSAFLLLGTGSVSTTNFTVKLNTESLYEVPYNYIGPVQMIFGTTPIGSFVNVTEFV